MIMILLTYGQNWNQELYMSNSEDKSDILNSYRKAKNDELNKTHVIKEFKGKTDRHDSCVVYTDGSAKGSSQSRDEKSFAGWGIYFIHTDKRGRESHGTKYSNLYNSDPLEAELRAALEGLKFNKYPAHFDLVSDSADVIEGIQDIHEKVSKYHQIKSKDESECSSDEKKQFRYLKIWNQINSEINSNDNIISLKVRWVRSHSLDKLGTNLPDPDNFENPEDKQLVKDCLGNEKADKSANMGAIKSIKSSLYFYINIHQNENEKRRSMMTSRKNFMASRFATDEAIRFLSAQDANFLPKDVMEGIFDPNTLSKIHEARTEINKGRDPAQVLKSILHSKQIITLAESSSTRDFMNKCRENVDIENESMAM